MLWQHGCGILKAKTLVLYVSKHSNSLALDVKHQVTNVYLVLLFIIIKKLKENVVITFIYTA